jgi:hypothetical protein
MEHRERADEVEKEIDRLEHESEKLGENAAQARSEWEGAKSDPSKAPGAAGPESSGPHNIDAEDPATGEKYGERRSEEMEEARAADDEAAADDDSQQDADNDST